MDPLETPVRKRRTWPKIVATIVALCAAIPVLGGLLLLAALAIGCSGNNPCIG